MTKLVCVPVEPTEEMLQAGGELAMRPNMSYSLMLAAAPPLPPDIREALELAKGFVETAYGNMTYEQGREVARALLKSHGREG